MHAHCAKIISPSAQMKDGSEAGIQPYSYLALLNCGWGMARGNGCPICNGRGSDLCSGCYREPVMCARIFPTRSAWVEQLRRDLPRLARGDALLEQQLAVCLVPPVRAWDLVLALGHVARRPFTDEERKAIAAAMSVPTAPEIPRLTEVADLARAMPDSVRAQAMRDAGRVAERLLGRMRDLVRVQDKRNELPLWASDWSDLCCDRADLQAVLRALDLSQDEMWSPSALRHLDAEAGAVDQEGIRVNARQRARRERESNPCAWWL